MSSEPPRMDIIASGDHRQREGGIEREGEREGLFYSPPLKMAVFTEFCLISCQTISSFMW